jgi:hypothetical protein
MFLVLTALAGVNHVAAQGTAFTYQGHLVSGTNAANGNYDLTFELFDATTGGSQVGSTLTNLNVGVTNGMFTATADFGAVFNGAAYWLEIGVRTNGGSTFTALSPRQELTPVPYSITAQNVTGAVTLAQLPSGLVTNNETNVAFVNLTLSSNLTLPSPAAIDSGGSSLLRSGNNNDFYAGPGAGSLTNSGSANTGIGVLSLQNNTSGTNDTALGYASLGNNTNGSYNVAVGERALAGNTSGNDNTAEGRHAMVNNVNGMDNTASGYEALGNNNGSYNTANGSSALSSITSGSNNIALGYQAGNNYGLSESSNILIGSPGVGGDYNIIRIGNGQTQTYIAGVINGNGGGLTNVPGASSIRNNPGTLNFFAGQSAGNQTMTGTYNTGVGDGALSVNSTGDYNTANGAYALAANTAGGNNTAVGVFALWQNTNGSGNTALGADALAYNTGGSDNTATGLGALENNTSSDNTADGVNALNNNEGGFQNTGIGYGALSANTSGNYNTATGAGALGNNNGSDNAAFGAGALGLNDSGTNNVAVGESAMAFNQTGYNNTATGYAALAFSTSGVNNTAYGYYSMGGTFSSSGGNTATGGYSLYGITDGYNNTAAGYEALEDNSSGVDNIGIGVATFQINETGSGNTAIGTYAFQNMSIGSGNVGVGMYAGYDLAEGTNNIYIGNYGDEYDNNVIRIGQGQSETYIAGTVNCGALISGAHTCCAITITGGCDLAEPFPVSTPEQQVGEGAVMVIDEKNPGQLKLASRPYDTRVAGVVSGANGINTGIQMQQQGLMEGGKNVALTGRVYVQADAANGAIEPGDLLTTSSAPGRAMKVTDHVRAQGAILGKAMTGLSEGEGMVLVLVTLQ